VFPSCLEFKRVYVRCASVDFLQLFMAKNDASDLRQAAVSLETHLTDTHTHTHLKDY